jgi:hypothetical protein
VTDQSIHLCSFAFEKIAPLHIWKGFPASILFGIVRNQPRSVEVKAGKFAGIIRDTRFLLSILYAAGRREDPPNQGDR